MKTVLIAEDEFSNYLYLAELFEGTDTRIIYAANGMEALDICRDNSSIDLVLMDIRMPVMNGYIAAKQIKELRPNLPIIAQTAYALETAMKGLSGNFDDFLIKPISRGIFKQKVSKFITLENNIEK
ncbi:MAG TPA: response regulator [Bacteroidales bacterium]|nr:response regulator [Bacteroidales bacterium]